MNSIWTLAIFAVVAAVAVPQLMDTATVETIHVAVQTNEQAQDNPGRRGSGQAVAYRDASGQFSFNARLNGVLDNVLVDTGASYVAINETLADRVGVKFRSGRKVNVSTANGKTIAHKGVINEIGINDIYVRNVEVLVLPDTSLSHSLLGMTFLKRLNRFEIESQQLTLTH